MTDSIPPPRAGRPIDPASVAGEWADALAARGAAPQRPTHGQHSLFVVLVSIGGLFIGPLSVAALSVGVSCLMAGIHDRVRVVRHAAFAVALGVLGEVTWVAHGFSLVNWTQWL